MGQRCAACHDRHEEGGCHRFFRKQPGQEASRGDYAPAAHVSVDSAHREQHGEEILRAGSPLDRDVPSIMKGKEPRGGNCRGGISSEAAYQEKQDQYGKNEETQIDNMERQWAFIPDARHQPEVCLTAKRAEEVAKRVGGCQCSEERASAHLFEE